MDNVTLQDELLPRSAAERNDFLVGRWYAIKCAQRNHVRVSLAPRWFKRRRQFDHYAWNAAWRLECGRPFSEYLSWSRRYKNALEMRYVVSRVHEDNFYMLEDRYLGECFVLSLDLVRNSRFDIARWFRRQLRRRIIATYDPEVNYDGLWRLFGYENPEGRPAENHDDDDSDCVPDLDYYSDSSDDDFDDQEDPDDREEFDIFSSYNNDNTKEHEVEDLGDWSIFEDYNKWHLPAVAGMAAAQTDNETVLPSVMRTATVPKDPSRIVPNYITIVVHVNGEPARALIDTGSLCDFISSSFADQLKVKKEELATPLTVQLAALGSRTKVNYRTTVDFKYQGIKETRSFDIMNLPNHDLILGTPFLYQHRVMVGFNETRIVIGSNTALPIKGAAVRTLASRSAMLRELNLEEAREYLKSLAEPLCKTAGETNLPPLRAINHRIDLIDDDKVYPWRPARCPEAFMDQWVEKRTAYVNTGRWQVTSSRNSVPMMYIPKPSKNGEPPKLRTVIDLRARNANTKKMASPLPDIDGIMRRVASKKYRTLLDMKDAYEQTRIRPEDVWKTAFATPNGNMVSNVLQIGDINAPATHQSSMNHIFSQYIGRFMDVYLDDIVIYSHTLKEHIEHVKIVLDILKKEKFYLSAGKLEFICKRVKILGRIVDDDGIQMDPHKVDALINWKVPTNRDLLRGFLGAAGYLADDIDRVRIPMGVLHTLMSDAVPFRWDFTAYRLGVSTA